MLNRLKRWLGWGPPPPSEEEQPLTWLPAESANPFGVHLLDCRPITWSLIATTGDPQIAARFVELRRSDGRDLIGQRMDHSVHLERSLTLPHNGAPLEGIVSKADVMEVKWDIYVYDSVFLFARSWTGDLRYRAFAEVGRADIRISAIECFPEDAELAASTVYFLLATHAMGRVFPHQVPEGLTTEGSRAVALWSFAQFGKLACYATVADITSIPIEPPPE